MEYFGSLLWNFSSLRFSALNSNLPGGGRNALCYILFYYFLVAHQNFKKFDGFSYNLSGIDFLIFYDIPMIFDFLEIRTGFWVPAFFQNKMLIFPYIFCWNNGYSFPQPQAPLPTPYPLGCLMSKNNYRSVPSRGVFTTMSNIYGVIILRK